MVWVAEAFNSALERLGDAINHQPDPNVGLAKDIAAAAVLFSLVGASLICVLVFWPHLQSLWRI
jgi:diacylglycerol kinase (ATP)